MHYVEYDILAEEGKMSKEIHFLFIETKKRERERSYIGGKASNSIIAENVAFDIMLGLDQ